MNNDEYEMAKTKKRNYSTHKEMRKKTSWVDFSDDKVNLKD
jgi:hypothetical protein